MAFTSPQALAVKFSPAPKEDAREAVSRALSNFPELIEDATFDFLTAHACWFDVAKLNHVHPQMSIFRNSPNSAAVALANFIEFQDVAGLSRAPFKWDPSTPPQVERLFRWAAQQLDAYAGPQATELRRVVLKVVRWCKQARHVAVYIIDSPLGGSFPAAVLAKALLEAGIDARVEELLAPRLDRHSHKHSIREAAKEITARLENKAWPVIFIDEVLTGSRFTKLYDALKKHRYNLLIPIALELRPPSASGNRTLRSLHQRLAAVRKTTGAPTQCLLPRLPQMRVDGGAPFESSNKFYWAELDLCAGKRKVNLLFGLLWKLQTIAADLADPTSPTTQHLIDLWRSADDGQRYEGHDEQITKSFPTLIKKIDWELLQLKARTAFPADYTGTAPAPTEHWVWDRLTWALDNIADQALPGFQATNSPNMGWVIRRALEDLFAYYQGHAPTIMPRDRDFAEYTLRFAHPHRAFHEELVERCHMRLLHC